MVLGPPLNCGGEESVPKPEEGTSYFSNEQAIGHLKAIVKPLEVEGLRNWSYLFQ